MSLRTRIGMAVAFSASALASFVLLSPGEAHSFIRTEAGYGCRVVPENCCGYPAGANAWYCAIPAGTDVVGANVTGAYLDALNGNASGQWAELAKQSYTGTTYYDMINLPSGNNTTWGDFYIAATNVKAAPSSPYDYYSVATLLMSNTPNTSLWVLGVALTTT